VAKSEIKMNRVVLFDKSSIQGATRVAKRERSFELSLPILVTGIDASGNELQEYSELTSISSQEAIFFLDSAVTIGSRLKLSLDVPKTILLENDLKLEMTGRVTYVKAEQNSEKRQFIVLQLDKKYNIHSFPLSKI